MADGTDVKHVRKEWMKLRPTDEPASAREPGARTVVLAREPLHEQILPHIRADIIAGRWPPGERLPEPVLCSEFGISRTPLRDAMKLLEAEGFVELLPHVGAVVTDPSVDEVAEKMEVLSALEQSAAAKVARTRPPAAIETIQRLHAGMVAAARKHDPQTYFRLNDEFHRAIVLGAANKTLADMHEQIMWHVHRARRRANDYERFDEDQADHHARIVQQIVSGKAASASEAVLEHLTDVSALILGRKKPRAPKE
jgi:DNA-binding GntR family transcriptional regulator